MKKTSKQTGTIKQAGFLSGARAAVEKRQTTGRLVVKLLEERGAYKVGDSVQLGTGEFQPDDSIVPSEPFYPDPAN